MPLIEASVPIQCDIHFAFDFLTRTENIPKIVPPDMQLRLVRCPEQLGHGIQFEVQILGYGPAQNVVYEITEYARPHRFVERQIKGPLKRFQHEHSLVLGEDGAVVMTDRIEFEPPGGLLGFLVTEERLRTSLQAGLVHRHHEVKRLLETS